MKRLMILAMSVVALTATFITMSSCSDDDVKNETFTLKITVDTGSLPEPYASALKGAETSQSLRTDKDLAIRAFDEAVAKAESQIQTGMDGAAQDTKLYDFSVTIQLLDSSGKIIKERIFVPNRNSAL